MTAAVGAGPLRPVGDGAGDDPPRWDRADRRAVVVGTVAWVAIVVLARWAGREHALTWKVTAVPLMGEIDGHLSVVTLLALAAGLALAARLPAWCAAVSWRRLLGGVALLTIGWGLTLALVRGPDELDRSVVSEHEYPAVVDDVDAIGVDRFVATLSDESVLRRYPIHVQGHPVGAPLVFVGLDRVGLGGPWGAVTFLLVAGGVVPVAVLVAVRDVAGESWARRAAPFLVLSPAAIWSVTSTDVLFAAVIASSIALVSVASSRPDRGTELVLAGVGGVAFGLAVELTYGAVPLVLIPVVIALARRRVATLVAAAAGGLVVIAGFGAVGFWWWEGLEATRERYVSGVASLRPRGYWTFLGNPAAFALAVGPAAVAGLARGRGGRLYLLVGPALAAVLVANLSGLSKAEVERIWLPYAPWITLAAATFAPRRRQPLRSAAGAVLAMQVVVAVAVESVVRTPW